MSARSTLSDSQLAQLKDLFEEAIALPWETRERFIRDSTASDRALARELTSLNEAHEKSGRFFEDLSDSVIRPALSSLDLEEVPLEPAVNRVVSHYELIERVGSGGMGVVYKARDTRLGRTVALKFLPRQHARNPSARAQLLAEARAASRLDHPNIGVVYEIGEAEDGRQFIAMAWYDGETLKDRIRRERISPRYALSVGLQLANALAAAHRAGIIHRDVKPANVIVTTAGTAKLVDFGIAKLASDDEGERSAIAGTLGYMSPEQTEDSPLDARTDIWSLGVLLYEAVAGHRPFRGENDVAIMEAIRTERPKSLAVIRPDVGHSLARIVERCLEKNPSNRFQSADELARALESAGVPSESGRAAGPRYRFAIGGIVAIATAIALAAWAYSTSPETSRAEALLSPAGIAVVPFAVSGHDSTRYLSSALAEDVREELARIPTIATPGIFSTEEYTTTKKSARQIASETGARAVIFGSAEQTHAGLRLSVRLVDGRSGLEIFAKAYNNGIDDSDLVRRVVRDVVQEMEIDLTGAEAKALGQPRFTSDRAFDFYLRGRHEELLAQPRRVPSQVSVDNIRRAQAYYSHARALDPGFAAPRARLAATHLLSAQLFDTTVARRDQARIEAETALRLDSMSSAARLSLARYWGEAGNPQKKLEILENAAEATPNDASVLLALGLVYRESGRMDETIALYERALRLDPRNPFLLFGVAVTYGRSRRYGDAMSAHRRLLAVWPTSYEASLIKGHAFLRWKGSADTLAAEAARIPPGWDVRGMATYSRYVAYRVQRRPREGLAMLDSSRSRLSRDGIVYQPSSLMRAELLHDLGDAERARHYYELSRRELEDSAAKNPKDGSILIPLGLTYASLGRTRDANAVTNRALEMAGLATNTPLATAYQGGAVEVYARMGDLDRAFETIELLLTMTSGRDMSLPLMAVWPGFDPLRKDPRYEQIMQRFTAR